MHFGLIFILILYTIVSLNQDIFAVRKGPEHQEKYISLPAKTEVMAYRHLNSFVILVLICFTTLYIVLIFLKFGIFFNLSRTLLKTTVVIENFQVKDYYFFYWVIPDWITECSP